MRLFDKIGYQTDRNDPDSPKRLLSEDHALYVLEENAAEAARMIFKGMSGTHMCPLLFLPLPKVCFEWTRPGGLSMQSTETGKVGSWKRARFLAILDSVLEEVDAFTSEPAMPIIRVALGVEIEDQLIGFASAHIGCRPAGEKNLVPWDFLDPNKDEIEIHEQVWEEAIERIVTGLAFINSPNLHERERVDMAKLNKKRLGTGKTALSNYTVIRPNSETKQWVRDTRESEKPGVSEHWVKAHRHTYLTGPGRTRTQVKLLAPFKRGNPDFGVKEPRYRVTAAPTENST